MEKDLRAKELALEAATIVFFVVALVGIAAGAEGYVAVLRALAAAVAVAYVGRFPARVILTALQPPAPPEAGQGDGEATAEAAAAAPAADRRAA